MSLLNNIVQSAGTEFYSNDSVLFILANLTSSRLYNAYIQRVNILRDNIPKSNYNPHITLLELHINNNHRLAYIFSDKNIPAYLQQIYADKFNNVILKSGYGQYDLLGQSDKKFFVRRYKSTNTDAITRFRIAFYRYIEKKFNIKHNKRRKIVKNGISYYEYIYGNTPLYTIPEYYHGRGIWKPHLSYISTSEIKYIKRKHPNSYAKLYSNYKYDFENLSTNDKLRHLIKIIHKYGAKKKITSMGTINMGRDMARITYSLK